MLIQNAWSNRHGHIESTQAAGGQMPRSRASQQYLLRKKRYSFNFPAQILPADTCSWSSNFMVSSFILYPSGYRHPPVADSHCWNKIFKVTVGSNHAESLLSSEERDTFGFVSKYYRVYLKIQISQ